MGLKIDNLRKMETLRIVSDDGDDLWYDVRAVQADFRARRRWSNRFWTVAYFVGVVAAVGVTVAATVG